MPTIKRTNRAFITMFGVIIAVVTFAGPARAAPYTNQATISVSDQTPRAGSRLTVCGTDFHARTRVTITLDKHRRLSSVFTNRSGAFCTTVRLPDRVTGAHSIVAKDRKGNTASVLIQIARKHHFGTQAVGVSVSSGTPIRVAEVSYKAGTSGFAVDDAAVIGISAVAGLLLFGGGLILFAGRRRKVVQ